MKIVVLEGSPNKKGSTHLLADCFRQGAEEAGHTVELIDVAHADLHPCTGCIHCGYEGPCVQKDDVERIRRKILDADMMVFATPLYYYGISAQLKAMIDRFCAFNSSIQRKHMKSVLLTVAWNSDDWTFEALEAHYKTLVRYLNLTDMGNSVHDAALGISAAGVSFGKPAERQIKREKWVRQAASPILCNFVEKEAIL